MNRRTFLQSAAALAASALVPSWFKLSSVTSIDLQAFCTEDFRRYNCAKPFVQEVADMGSARFATNGRICLRVPTAEIPQGEPDAKLPPANNLDWPDLDKGGWNPWPSQYYLDAADSCCPQCDGYGVFPNKGECEACYGIGEISDADFWTSVPAAKCKECRGTGNAGPVCTHCQGKAIGVFPAVQCLGGGYVDAKLDRLMRRHLGGVEWKIGPKIRHHTTGKETGTPVVQFRFDGGCGLLVPLDHGAVVDRIRKAG